VWTVLYSTFNHTVNASGGQYSPVILALANDRRLDCFEPGPKKKKKKLVCSLLYSRANNYHGRRAIDRFC